jgi:hypothetical protein
MLSEKLLAKANRQDAYRTHVSYAEGREFKQVGWLEVLWHF